MRINPKTLEKLDSMAKKEQRNRSNMLAYLIESPLL